MPVRFLWDESYSVANEELDRQHREMFELAGSLPETMDKLAVQRTVVAIFKHARRHFETEERVMKEMGYPLLDAHRELHDDLITTLNELCEEPLDSPESLLRFKRFVYDWLVTHIMHDDKGYAQFIREKQQKAA